MDAPPGGLVALAAHLAPLVTVARVPIGIALTFALRFLAPLGGPALDLYASLQPEGDKELLGRPEFKAMFLDDLLNGSRKQVTAPLSDLILFSRLLGLHAADVTVPVRWWHGDDDHIVPHRHGEHMVKIPARRHSADDRGEPPLRPGPRRGSDHAGLPGRRGGARPES